MDMHFKDTFQRDWDAYFPGADLPIGFYYTDTAEHGCLAAIPKAHHCLIGELAKVRKGKTLCFNTATVGCFGGRRYLGFETLVRPDFEYFLSCGIPGKLEGERYKKTPELVMEHVKNWPPLPAPRDYIVFKRWDRMTENDQPIVIVFFATPDVLSGLFTLANFDEPQINGVIAPFGAGCATIVDYPRRELDSREPRAVLGMFDVSARPCIPPGTLTFAVPWPKFVRMVDNMGESFLITKSWKKVRTRIKRESSGTP